MSRSHEVVHALIYGDSGAGKSTGASTFPKPMLVWMFDPIGKETPYLRRGDSAATMAALGGVQVDPSGRVADDLGTPCRYVVSPSTGRVIIKIEHYIDRDPTTPEAYRRFLQRLTRLEEDIEKEGYKTVVVDSVTFMELAARKHQQYVLNPNSKEPRQWFAGSTDTLEEVLMIRLGSLPITVVVLAHIDEDKDEVNGTMVRHPAAPGRLRKRSPAGYSELYRAYVKRGPTVGEREYLWQTQSDPLWNAATQVGAPDPCVQSYAAIWT